MTLSSKVKTPLLAAAALVAFAPAAAAQPPAPQPDTDTTEPADEATQAVNSHIYVNGAVKDPADRGTPAAEDRTVPELPIVYEDDA